MSHKRKSAKMGRLSEVGIALVGVSVIAYLGISKVQEYRKPRGPVMEYTVKAIDATKQAAIVATSEAPRSFLAQFKLPKSQPSELELLDQKLAQNPDDRESLESRYQIHLANQSTELAQADLELLLSLSGPELPASEYHERAFYQAMFEGDYEGALPRAEYALQARPKNVQFQETLAHIYVGLGRDEEAIQLYDDILKANPDSVEALYTRAVAFRRLGNQDMASAGFLEAAKIDRDFCQHWDKRLGPDPGWHGEENPSPMGG